MLQDDLRTPLAKQEKQKLDDHPIDRILTAYFDRNNQIKQSQSNNNYKSETRQIIQRQRVIRSFLHRPDETEPSIRKPITIDTKPKALRITSMSPPQMLFAELNGSPVGPTSARPLNMKKELQRQSAILIRRRPPTLLDEPSPLFHVPSDISHLPPSQMSLMIPSHFTFRSPPANGSLSERSPFKFPDPVPAESAKRMNFWKNTREKSGYPKLIQRNHSLPLPKWTPTLFEQGELHQRTMSGFARSKSQLTKFSLFRPQPTLSPAERMAFNARNSQIQELFISPRSSNYSQDEVKRKKQTEPPRETVDDEWDESPMIHEDLSDDEDEFHSGDSDSVISRCNSRQYHQSSTRSFSDAKFTSSSSSSNSTIDDSKRQVPGGPIKRSPTRRRPYNLALPPVAEHVDDDNDEHETERHDDRFRPDLKTILGQLLSGRTRAFNEGNAQHGAFDEDEDSLTFQLLNQQETEFERNLSKLRSFHAKGKF